MSSNLGFFLINLILRKNCSQKGLLNINLQGAFVAYKIDHILREESLEGTRGPTDAQWRPSKDLQLALLGLIRKS